MIAGCQAPINYCIGRLKYNAHIIMVFKSCFLSCWFFNWTIPIRQSARVWIAEAGQRSACNPTLMSERKMSTTHRSNKSSHHGDEQGEDGHQHPGLTEPPEHPGQRRPVRPSPLELLVPQPLQSEWCITQHTVFQTSGQVSGLFV